MGKKINIIIIVFTLIIVILFVGFMLYAKDYEMSNSLYPNCTKMIKTDTMNVIVDGRMIRKDIKSIVYSCKDGRIIQTNESIR